MKGDDFRTVVEAINIAVKDAEKRLLETVDLKLASYRRAVWVRTEWCCKNMEAFAAHFWGIPRPKRDYEWGTELQIRGTTVNYCPFCGVFVGPKESA